MANAHPKPRLRASARRALITAAAANRRYKAGRPNAFHLYDPAKP
ncbi:hypothetical protein Airi02_095480 [Actinoallomurus iriomotensis]|uniref:Uncharacterized protein n=2 Tax=Actinoallomurus iriomotensis TaxID=478107 RepID=A0A9W6SB48_9ACTN|nr:hypothetical protein Airi02_095480 [Actinoallomurus iriomotensis]